ncbi:hypothetical protein [Sphingomonas sp. 1P08PE]|uniref:hypothetical protein n=1 Tax=Sphingomonas sp. 1P08PE TaxID=554122 RepID=UPI0039A3A772
MRGLIARILAGQAAPVRHPLVADIEDSIAARRRERLSRPASNEAKRFARAQPKVDQLRHEYAMRHVTF